MKIEWVLSSAADAVWVGFAKRKLEQMLAQKLTHKYYDLGTVQIFIRIPTPGFAFVRIESDTGGTFHTIHLVGTAPAQKQRYAFVSGKTVLGEGYEVPDVSSTFLFAGATGGWAMLFDQSAYKVTLLKRGKVRKQFSTPPPEVTNGVYAGIVNRRVYTGSETPIAVHQTGRYPYAALPTYEHGLIPEVFFYTVPKADDEPLRSVELRQYAEPVVLANLGAATVETFAVNQVATGPEVEYRLPQWAAVTSGVAMAPPSVVTPLGGDAAFASLSWAELLSATPDPLSSSKHRFVCTAHTVVLMVNGSSWEQVAHKQVPVTLTNLLGVGAVSTAGDTFGGYGALSALNLNNIFLQSFDWGTAAISVGGGVFGHRAANGKKILVWWHVNAVCTAASPGTATFVRTTEVSVEVDATEVFRATIDTSTQTTSGAPPSLSLNDTATAVEEWNGFVSVKLSRGVTTTSLYINTATNAVSQRTPGVTRALAGGRYAIASVLSGALAGQQMGVVDVYDGATRLGPVSSPSGAPNNFAVVFPTKTENTVVVLVVESGVPKARWFTLTRDEEGLYSWVEKKTETLTYTPEETPYTRLTVAPIEGFPI